MMEVASTMENISMMDTRDFWEDLKQKLEEELTESEQERVSYLVSDTIRTMCKGKVNVRSTRELLNILENCMFYEEALSVLEHAFGYEDFFPEYEEKSFGQIIGDYRLGRDRFGCSNIIGRESEIRGAISKLVNSDSKGVWIYGMGGLGKTMLANEISGRLAIYYKATALKFDLKQVRSAADVIKIILAKFEVYTRNTDTLTLTSELLYQLKSVSHDTCMVLDNIEEVYEFDTNGLHHVLQRCFDGPAYMPIKWIITSRREIDPDIEIPGISKLKLEPLNDNSAEKLLRLSVRPIELTEEKCQRILEMTGRNPLAIRVLSSAVKSSWHNDNLDNFSFLNFRLQNGMKECIEYAFMFLTEVEINQLHSLSVVETSQFDIEIVNAVLGFKDRKEGILLMMKLTNHQIVQIICYGQYCLHPLILDYVINLEGHEEHSIQAQNNFCLHMITRIEPYVQHADKNYIKAVAKVSDNQPLLKVLFHVLSIRNNDSNDLFTPNVNKYLTQLRDMIPMTQSDKNNLYENITKQMFSSDRRQVYVFWKLEEIRMMIDDKRFAEAGKELSGIDEEFQKTCNDSMDNIKGRFWYIKGRYFRCKECKEYTKAIECLSKSRHFNMNSNDVPECAMALNALGNTYFDMKDDDMALSYHQQAFDMLHRFLSNDLHPDLSVYEFNVGTIYLAKASKELSIFKCVTVNARKYLEKALEIFENSMAKDEKMKTHRMPKYGNKLAEKAKALFYLSTDTSKRTEAINNMKESLELRLAPYTNPDKIRTSTFSKTGQTFIAWREDVQNDPPIAKLLLKEAIYCFRMAEEDITKSESAHLDGKDKTDFIHVYQKIASQGLVRRDEASNIRSFCQKYERGVSFDSSSSSSSSSSDTPSSGRDDSDSDEVNYSCDNHSDSDNGILSTRNEKETANQFENEFFNKINKQVVPDKDIKKRRRSSSSESD